MMSWRKFNRQLHLWLGLSVGLLFLIIALSGAAIVFYVEIDQWLHDLPVKTTKNVGKPDWDQALQTLRQTYPDKTGPWRFEVTPDAQIIPARYYQPAETRGEHFAPMLVWLSADGTAILRKDYWGHFAMTWLYNLHYQLLLGSTGTLVLGYIGLAISLLLVSGLYHWWPKVGQWRKSLSFRRRTITIGLLADLHKFIGVFSCVPLFVLTITGVMLALPQPTEQLLQQLFGPKVQPAFKIWSAPTTSTEPLAIATAIQQLDSHFPAATLAWIEVPAISGGFYKFRLQQPTDPSRRFPHSYLQMNQYSGEVVLVIDSQKGSVSEQIKLWLHPLHDGSAGGNGLRWGWLFIGMMPVLLYVSGLWRYYLRRPRKAKSVVAKA